MDIVAIDIGGTSIKLAISDENGQLKKFWEIDTEAQKGGRFIVQKIIDELSKINHFDKIGISTAGQVDPIRGTIIYANPNIPNYTGTPLKEIFEKTFKVPVKVENDVNAAALGEKHYGAAKELRDFLCLTYGTGIGGAIFQQHQLYRGNDGIAAEFGHLLMHLDQQKPVYYEHLASTGALVRQAAQIDSRAVNGRWIYEQVIAGNEEMIAVLERWLDYVAQGLASLVHCFNPAAFVLGGGIMEQTEIVKRLEVKVKAIVMPSFAKFSMINASLGNKAGILGAVSLHTKQLS